MNSKLSVVCRFFLVSAVFIFFCDLAADDKPAALVIMTKGNTKLIRSGKTQKIAKDTLVVANDIIETEDKSSVSLQFSDGVVYQVYPKSSVKLDLIENNPKQLKVVSTVQKGSVGSDIDKSNKKVDMSVKTPTCTAGVRGTELIVETDGVSSNVLVDEGTVSVTNPNGQSTKVEAGKKVTSDGASFKSGILEEFDKEKFRILEELNSFKKANYDEYLEQLRKNKEMLNNQKNQPIQ